MYVCVYIYIFCIGYPHRHLLFSGAFFDGGSRCSFMDSVIQRSPWPVPCSLACRRCESSRGSDAKTEKEK